MSNTNPSVSVVVPARNAATTIGAQLAALMAQEYDGDLEIIVVDNASTDSTAEFVERFGGNRWPIRVVCEPIAGLNRARNAGVSQAVGDFVLLCDADDIVQRGWVVGLARALRGADLVGGALDTLALNSSLAREMWMVDPMVRPRGDFVGFASPWGCNCGFRRQTWAAVGGFDPKLSYLMDEIEFFVRAQVGGFRLVFADGAVVQYRLREDRRSVLRRVFQNGMGEALLASRFSARQRGRDAPRTALRAWAWLVLRAPWALINQRFRWRWLRTAARRSGRLVGSLKYRVLCL